MSAPIPVFGERPKAVPTPKLRALVKFPGTIIGTTGIEVSKANGNVTIETDWTDFGAISAIPTSPTSYILTFDSATGAYVLVPSHLLGGAVSGIADAPNNGIQYGRQSTGWTPVLPTYVNIAHYGGIGDGVTANDAAFDAAWAQLPARGGCIYFPAGKYLFTNQFTRTYPSTRFAVTIMGDGSNNTILYWPNGEGMQFTNNTAIGSIHIRGISVTTGAVNAGIGIALINSATQPNCAWSDFYDVMVHGDDLNVSSAKYWSTAVYVKVWSQINFTNLNTYGICGTAPGTAGGGTGVKYEGDAGTANYGVIYNFQSCSFNGHDYGMWYGDYVQGVTVNQCNFNGAVGITAIYAPNPVGVLAQLCITNCQVNYAGVQISLTGMNALSVCNNVITSYGPAAAGIGIDLISCNVFQIVGNLFNVFGVASNTVAIVAQTATTKGTITGNVFAGQDLGVNLATGTSKIFVIGNCYDILSATYVNNGSSPTPGVTPMP